MFRVGSSLCEVAAARFDDVDPGGGRIAPRVARRRVAVASMQARSAEARLAQRGGSLVVAGEVAVHAALDERREGHLEAALDRREAGAADPYVGEVEAAVEAAFHRGEAAPHAVYVVVPEVGQQTLGDDRE